MIYQDRSSLQMFCRAQHSVTVVTAGAWIILEAGDGGVSGLATSQEHGRPCFTLWLRWIRRGERLGRTTAMIFVVDPTKHPIPVLLKHL